ncbi:2176_t:CDS:1, partial [Acaulospora colombiana]
TYTLEANGVVTVVTTTNTVPPASELPSGLTVIGPSSTVVGASPYDESLATYTIINGDSSIVITTSGSLLPATAIPSGYEVIGPSTTIIGASPNPDSY